jgi:hypothetical protein
MKKVKHPMQKLVWVDDVIRFQENKLVEYLLDNGGIDLNHLARLPDIPQADREQFAQLIGYSVSGFGDLSYASEKTVRKADKKAAKMAKEKYGL